MFPCRSMVNSLMSTKDFQRISFSSASLSSPSTVRCHRVKWSLCLGTCQVNTHIPDVIPAKRLEHMLDVFATHMQQEIADFGPHIPLIAMMVPQARVSKGSVEQIAQFDVVMVTPVDHGCLWTAEPRADCGGEGDNKQRVTERVAEEILDVFVSQRDKENVKVFHHFPRFVVQWRKNGEAPEHESLCFGSVRCACFLMLFQAIC